jgi:hypothetical protein
MRAWVELAKTATSKEDRAKCLKKVEELSDQAKVISNRI